MPRILIIEDEPTTVVLVRHCLQNQGHRVLEARDGAEGLRIAMEERPDAVILDVNLPHLSGFEICEALRRADFSGAILMLTARHSMDDKIAGLSRGADDYICKPFDIRELIARISALLRRRARQDQNSLQCRLGDVEVDFAQKQVRKAGKPLALTKTEWGLLSILIKNEGRPVSRDQMLDSVWGYDQSPSTRTIDTHVYRLRRKLSQEGNAEPLIENVHGQGYRLISDAERSIPVG
ncbi:MAG: response regulator transcription factor [Opitutaceae bacterium]|jgi:DNA-binding response OmpR family regulator